ncbi:hypothetical protein NHQ30_006982 [Ciborinia camelliae]|nr:hypothetical protein NHQ30_006982 [Ciborinia camelliae]
MSGSSSRDAEKTTPLHWIIIPGSPMQDSTVSRSARRLRTARLYMSSNRRTNDSTEANIYRGNIFASGTFKNVWEGRYTSGSRDDQRCVAKEFKSGSVFEKSYFDGELRIISRAQAIIDDFNAAHILPGPNVNILLNTPAIWTYEGGPLTLVEPMIENFQKFNSNSGWASMDRRHDAMKALSHFSYHNSNREFLLCDLQGSAHGEG